MAWVINFQVLILGFGMALVVMVVTGDELWPFCNKRICALVLIHSIISILSDVICTIVFHAFLSDQLLLYTFCMIYQSGIFISIFFRQHKLRFSVE
jgi:hypothetical protein